MAALHRGLTITGHFVHEWRYHKCVDDRFKLEIFNCADFQVDVAALTPPDAYRVPDYGVDGFFGYAGSPAAVYRMNALYQCKVFPTAANPFGITGQQFAEIEYYRTALKKYARAEASRYLSAIEFLDLATNKVQEDALEAAEGTFKYFQELRKRVVERFNAWLRTLYALRKVTNCLSIIRKIFFVEYRPFRGFSWSKRAWSILHGSHPPKASALAAVGCV
jgi:hypothetical protein